MIVNPLSEGFSPEKEHRFNSLLKVNLIGFYTIVYKEIRRLLRIWVQTMVPPVITMTLYFVIFGSLIGQRIGQMEGVPYTTFIAPDTTNPRSSRQQSAGYIRQYRQQRIYWSDFFGSGHS